MIYFFSFIFLLHINKHNKSFFHLYVDWKLAIRRFGFFLILIEDLSEFLIFKKNEFYYNIDEIKIVYNWYF